MIWIRAEHLYCLNFEASARVKNSIGLSGRTDIILRRMNHHAPNPEHLALTRRGFLRRCGMGMGTIGLAGLLGNLGLLNTAHAETPMNPLAPKSPQFPGRAKRVVHIFANGGP